jgi:hypothetical protein
VVPDPVDLAITAQTMLADKMIRTPESEVTKFYVQVPIGARHALHIFTETDDGKGANLSVSLRNPSGSKVYVTGCGGNLRPSRENLITVIRHVLQLLKKHRPRRWHDLWNEIRRAPHA